VIVKLIEVVSRKEAQTLGALPEIKYSLREIFVNSDQVVCLRADDVVKQHLREGKMPDLDQSQNFTRIHMNRGNSGLDVVVVGSPHTVEEKIFKTQSRLLKG
tara:strand:+ start:2257 stop:2562 length:306 start_codon:yes stop_codon:yes gene_type:complete